MYRVVDYSRGSYLIAEVKTYKEAIKAAEKFYNENDGDCEIDIIDVEDGEEGITNEGLYSTLL